MPAIVTYKEKVANCRAMLTKYRGQLVQALPKHFPAERMARIVMTCVQQRAELLDAEPASLFGAIVTAAQLGLEPGIQNSCWLVPFKNAKRNFAREVQMIIGYGGLIDLAYRSDRLTWLYPYPVYKGDKFRHVLGTSAGIIHEPKLDVLKTPETLTAVYAVSKVNGVDGPFHVLGRKEILEARERSENWRKHPDTSSWTTDFIPMALKTAVRQICRYLPKSVELRDGLTLDDKADANESQAFEEVIDISFRESSDPPAAPPPSKLASKRKRIAAEPTIPDMPD